MQFLILGPMEVIAERGRRVPIVGAKARALLAVLLIDAGTVVSSDRLIDALWGDHAPASAMNALHVHLSSLRKALATGGGHLRSDVIGTLKPGYVLHVHPEQVDARRFERLSAEGARALRAGRVQAAARTLREALALWRGAALVDFAFDAFARPEIDRLEDLRAAAEEDRIEADLALGHTAALVPQLRALVARWPYRERLRAHLMTALYRAGRQAEALEAYAGAREVLADELGIDPSRALQQLEAAILRQDPVLDGTMQAGAASPFDESAPGIPRSQGALREERRRLTVLSCETVRPIRTSAEPDPEEVTTGIRRDRAAIGDEIEGLGGAVEGFDDNIVTAAFGATTAHEDDAARAVAAAFRIADSIVCPSAESGGDARSLRIGISTGDAIVITDGRPRVGWGTITGDVVGAAARVRTTLPVGPGEHRILVDRSTQRATRHVVDYRPVDDSTRDGRTAPDEIWEAVGIRAPGRVEIEPPSPTAMFGRERELRVLVDGLDRAQRDRSTQLITLLGVPGIGKSRLVAELRRMTGTGPAGVNWLRGKSLPFGSDTDYWALSQIVKAHAGIAENDPSETAAAKLRAAVRAAFPDDSEADPIEAHLRVLVGLAPGVRALADTTMDRHGAWRRFLEGVAERQPLVLVFEDLHWADDGTIDFVDHLVRWVRGVPLLVLCVARPEFLDRRSGWGGGAANATTLTIGPLSPEDSERLVDELLGGASLAAESRAALLDRADGNPLFAGEYVRMLRERGVLRTGADRDYASAVDLPLPESVRGTIAARIDTLSARERDLLQTAAVVGRAFWSGALSSALGADDTSLAMDLDELERKEFIRREHPSVVTGERQFTFLHVLIRDVAYGQIPRRRKAELHRRTGEWLAAAARDRTDDRAGMVAHHYLEALDLARASGMDSGPLIEPTLAALEDAGERAMALNAAETARRLTLRALELCDANAEPLRRASLLFRLARANFRLGDFDLDVARRAAEAVAATGDPEWAAAATALLADHEFLRMENHVALERLAQAFRFVETRPTSAVKATVRSDYGRRLLIAGEREAGALHAHAAVDMAMELGLDDVAANALIAIGIDRAERGDEAGLADLRRSIDLATRAGAADLIHRARNNLTLSLWDLGRLDEATEQIRLTRIAAERFGNLGALDWLDVIETSDLRLRGHWGQARVRADAFLDAHRDSPHYQEMSALSTRILVNLARGEVALALQDSDRALGLARHAGHPQVLHPILLKRAQALMAAGRDVDAGRLVDELMAAGPDLASMGMTGLATLMRQFGREQEYLTRASECWKSPWREAEMSAARGRFDVAAKIYASIGATGHEAEMQLEAAEAATAAADGDLMEAGRLASRAAAFFRRAGATEYARRAEAVLAAAHRGTSRT